MQDKSGMTLIELVVVIIVLSILSGIAFLAYPIVLERQAREGATKYRLGTLRATVLRHYGSSMQNPGGPSYPSAAEIMSEEIFAGGASPVNGLTGGRFVFAWDGTPEACSDIEESQRELAVWAGSRDTEPLPPDINIGGIVGGGNVGDIPSPVGPVGWLYQPETGMVWAATDDCQKTDTLGW